MAKVHIVVSRTNARADTGSTLPVPDAIPVQAMTVASAGVSQVVAVVPSSQSYLVCHVTGVGGAIWLAVGADGAADPDAGEGKGWLLQDGETRSLGVGGGQKIAIRDAVL